METANADVMAAYTAQRSPMMNRSAFVVRFFKEAVLDDKATNGWDEELYHPTTGLPYKKHHQGAGHDKFTEVDFIEMRRPGDTLSVIVRPVRPTDKASFPKDWEAYAKGHSEVTRGTPISVLPGIGKAYEMELKALGIATIENLRDVSDVDGQKIQGFAALKQRATDFLAAAEGDAPNERLRKELSSRDAEIETLKRQVASIVEAQNKASKKA